MRSQAYAERRGVRGGVEVLGHIGHPVRRRIERALLCVPAVVRKKRIKERNRCVARETRRGEARDVRLELEEEPKALAELQRIR